MKRKYLVVIGGLVVGAASLVLLTRTAKSSPASNPPQVSSTDNNSTAKLNLAEVANHHSQSDCWSVIEGSVYNLTPYLKYHPGGPRIIEACGIDASDLFSGKSAMGRMHSQMARQMLAKYKLGPLTK